jgi:gas vesicle protein
MSNGAGKFFGGLIVGTTIGAAIGILFAPRTGKETRQALRRSAKDLPKLAEDLGSNVQYQTDRLAEQAQRTIDEAMIRLQEAIATGQDASRKIQEELAMSINNSTNGSSKEVSELSGDDDE